MMFVASFILYGLATVEIIAITGLRARKAMIISVVSSVANFVTVILIAETKDPMLIIPSTAGNALATYIVIRWEKRRVKSDC